MTLKLIKWWRELSLLQKSGSLLSLFCGFLALITLLYFRSAPEGKTFHRHLYAAIDTLDPHRSQLLHESFILHDLYEGLVTLDAKGNLVPGAAESWSVSKDGLTWTFNLRKDGKWSNGDPVTSKDFHNSFLRVLKKETQAYRIENLLSIEGAVEFHEEKANDIGINSDEPYLLKIQLKRLNPLLFEFFTTKVGLPVHKNNYSGNAGSFLDPSHLVTNGPFTLAAYAPNTPIFLKKNPHYHDAENVYLDGITFHLDEKLTALRRFEAGELHEIRLRGFHQDFNDLKAKWQDQLKSSPVLANTVLRFNTHKEPFNSQKVRLALALGLDREALTRLKEGYQIPAWGLIPPGIEGYTPAEMKIEEADPTKTKDVSFAQERREEEARGLLKKAGFSHENPLRLTLSYAATDTTHVPSQISAIITQWQNIGVELGTLPRDVKGHYRHLREKGDFDIAYDSTTFPYADPQNYLDSNFKSNGQTFNIDNYHNKNFDKLMEKAEECKDSTERMETLHQAEAILLSDLPAIPLFFHLDSYLISPRLKGWELNARNLHLSRYISLTEDPSQKSPAPSEQPTPKSESPTPPQEEQPSPKPSPQLLPGAVPKGETPTPAGSSPPEAVPSPSPTPPPSTPYLTPTPATPANQPPESRP